MSYLILLNCVLIEENVRDCFLFWCKKTYKVKDYINKLFPNLIINDYIHFNNFCKFDTSDVILISKRIVYPNEYDTHEKLGRLLGYISSDKYEILNRELITYDYSFTVIIEDKKIVLFNEMSQTKLDHKKMYEKMRKVLIESEYGKMINNVILTERTIVPLSSIIKKLKNDEFITNEEKNELEKLFDENYDKHNRIKILERFIENDKMYICMSDESAKKYKNIYEKI